jgi:hypothetical protein
MRRGLVASGQIVCDAVPAAGAAGHFSDFGIKVEERIQAALQLFFDLLFAAFQDVHGNARLVPILELEGRISYFSNFLGRQ